MGEPVLVLIEAGSRHAVHASMSHDGVTLLATERCNLDSAFGRKTISREQMRGKPCRHCVPNGIPKG
jgi:hypothetical protein